MPLPARPLALVVVLTLSACVSPGRRYTDDPPTDRPGFARKLVTNKRPQGVLVARDATICYVDSRRYRRVSVGTEAWCYWRREGERNGR